MGLRFRKSIKVAPGVKLNLNKNSVSLTGGVRGAHHTISSSGRRTTSVGIPGTGLSYVSSSGGKKSSAKSKASNNNGGCLLSMLKILGIILLFTVFLGFGWIAGIIWLLFFRKRMSNNPRKQRNYTIGISIVSCISFLFFVYSIIFASLSPTELTLTSVVEGQELDVNSDYIIKVLYEPDDASLANVVYSVDEPLLATITQRSDDPAFFTLHTKNEGTISITAHDSEIESNILTFEIIDKERMEKEKAEAEQRRLEEEAAAKEAEEKRLEAEKAVAEKEQQIEAQKTAEEEAKRIAEENAAEETQFSEEEITPTAENTVQSETADSPMVWIDDSAKKYHSKNGCGMDNAYQVTLEEAISMGKTPCGRCY